MNMTVKSAFQQYHILVLYILERVLAYTTENYDFYTNPITSYNFENNTTGEHNTTTTAGEFPNEYHNCSMSEFDIVNVDPTEVTVDTTTDLQLSIANYTGTNSTLIFCFLCTPDNELEVLSSYWISETQITCTGFGPSVAGLFFVTADFSIGRANFDKKVTVRVISKDPVPEKAEYSYNFDKIFIYFDANIELQSKCVSAFSKKTLEFFGMGFRCFVTGNALVVKMGVDFKLTTVVEIRAGNKICRNGSGKEFCLFAKPGRIQVTIPKMAGPVLSLMTTSECANNTTEKYVSLKVFSNDQKQSLGEIFTPDHSGKNQRKNLIMWRTLRKIQNKLSPNMTFRIDKSDMEPLYQNLASVENFLGSETIQLGSSRSGVTVSVYVQSSPTVGTILAEADVMFCKNFKQLYRYKWIVNEKILPECDKLLILQDVAPGKFVIKCNIVAYNSSEVLGQGWAATEIFDTRPKVIVYPVERVSSVTENISLYAVIWNGGKISWVCRTKIGKVCVTTSQQLISDVLDMNAYNISIPAGVLPAGEYMWTVENAQGVNTAKLIIKLENAVIIDVRVSSVFVGQFHEVILKGTVKGLQNGCRLWWSNVRKKGFNYLNLQRIEGDTEVLVRNGATEQNIDLVFPRPLENWEGLEPDSLYIFKLQAFCPNSTFPKYIKIPLSVNNPPWVSPVEVEPTKGLAMATNFIISKVQADDSLEDYPLVFEWSYIDTCGIEVPITRGAYSRQITTFLPPGDIRMIVKVCDIKRACGKVSSSIIKVSHSKIIPENFYTTANQIYYLIISSDYLEAFGLATTVFKSLALKAETEIRYAVFRAIEEGIYVKIKQFNDSMKITPKGVKSCLDFVDRALSVAEYFPKHSGIHKPLTDFKNDILNIALKNHRA